MAFDLISVNKAAIEWGYWPQRFRQKLVRLDVEIIEMQIRTKWVRWYVRRQDLADIPKKTPGVKGPPR
jgi:hypothetical protein